MNENYSCPGRATRYVLIGIALLFSWVPVNAQSFCDEVLRQAGKNLFAIDQRRAFSAALRDKLSHMTDSQIEELDQGGGGISIPIDGIPIGLNFQGSSKEMRRFRDVFKRDSNYVISEDEAKFIFVSYGNSEAINAWRDCIMSEASDLRVRPIRPSTNSTAITFIVVFLPSPGELSGEVTLLDANGGSIDANTTTFKKGDTLKRDRQQTVIVQPTTKNSEVRLVVACGGYTGTATATIPNEPIPPKPPAPKPDVRRPVTYDIGDQGIGYELQGPGDCEMDTNHDDRATATCSSVLSPEGNKVVLLLTFQCEEGRGPVDRGNTSIGGTKRIEIPIPPEPGMRLIDVVARGGLRATFSGETRGENHAFNPFPTDQVERSHWQALSFRLDTREANDCPLVGVKGVVSFVCVFGPSE